MMNFFKSISLSAYSLSIPRGWLTAVAAATFMFLAAIMIPVQTSIASEAPDVEIQAVTDGIAAEFIAGGTREVLSP